MELDQEIRELEQAVAAGDMRAALKLGQLLLGMGRPTEAIKTLKQAMAEFPEAASSLLKAAKEAAKAAKKATEAEAWRKIYGDGRYMLWAVQTAARSAARLALSAARSSAKFVARTVSTFVEVGAAAATRVVGLLGPVGTAIAAAVLLAVIVAGLYVLLRTPEPSEPPWRSLGACVMCDCEHLDAGILNRAYIPDCKKIEEHLRDLVESGKFRVAVGPDGKLTFPLIPNEPYPFCDPVKSGPAAWPLLGGPPTPPPADNRPPCKYVGGVLGWDCPGK